jgi:hypothetical protein
MTYARSILVPLGFFASFVRQLSLVKDTKRKGIAWVEFARRNFGYRDCG